MDAGARWKEAMDRSAREPDRPTVTFGEMIKTDDVVLGRIELYFGLGFERHLLLILIDRGCTCGVVPRYRECLCG